MLEKPKVVRKYVMNFLEKKLISSEIQEKILNYFGELKAKHGATKQIGYVFECEGYRVIAHYKLLTNEHVLQPLKPSALNEISMLQKKGAFEYLE